MTEKILFFFPNTANRASIPTAMPILGGIAREHGWNVSYFDTTYYQKPQDAFEDKELTGGFKPGYITVKKEMLPIERLITDFQSQIDEFAPDILAITSMSCDFQYLMSFFPQIKIPEDTIVMIGGIHSILQPEKVIETGLFDLVCIGQGEKTFDEILTRIEKNDSIIDIEGTYFRDRKSGNVIRNSRGKLLEQDELWKVEPDYSFFDNRYFSYPFDEQMVNILLLEVARGCPYSCTYCGNSALRRIYRGLGKYICTRPLDSTFYILNKMVKKHNIDIVNIVDECFLSHSQPWLERFAERYAADIHKPFLIQTRPETVTETNIKILFSCGAPFFQVGMGVESGSENILFDVCNRRTKVKDIIRAYDLLNEYNIRGNAYFMIGFPYETRDDIFKTIELCRRINSSINSVSIFQPLPGQKLTELCIKEGFITGNEPMATFTSGSVLKMPQISAKEILNLRRTFMLYAKLPKEYYPEIEKCERDFEGNQDLFEKLVNLRWNHDENYKQINIKN
ncbi:B12-binding domain-containing radical SAM protein [Candidatus Pacearchaeota archaeon]|nr:B12-binding domain-containing radical SAM protein [Candidatus Pacearchaeota archaeon]